MVYYNDWWGKEWKINWQWNLDVKNVKKSFVVPRTSSYKGSLDQGSTVYCLIFTLYLFSSQMTAVISKSGDLKIVAGPEDSSDAESKLNST